MSYFSGGRPSREVNCKASSALLAIPAIPPSASIWLIKFICGLVGRPVGVLTSIPVNTPTVQPTMSDVILIGVIPIRSDPPGLQTP